MLGPGEARPEQHLPEHRVGRVRVGGGQAAERQRGDRRREAAPGQEGGEGRAGRPGEGVDGPELTTRRLTTLDPVHEVMQAVLPRCT